MPPRSIEDLNLAEWVEKANSLSDDEASKDQFVLTGLHPDGDIMHGLDILDSALDSRPDWDVDSRLAQLIRTRDVDSLIAIFRKTIPIDPAYSLEVMLNPHLTDSVSNNVGISAQISHQDETIDVPIHLLPNIAVATVANKTIRVAFPGLYRPAPDRPVWITQGHFKDLYDHGIKGAANTVVYQDRTHWPSSFQAEAIRARRTNGQQTRTTRAVPGENATRFLEELVKNCNNHELLPWARGAFYLVEARGIKAATGHELDAEGDVIDDSWRKRDLTKRQALQGLDVAACSERPTEDCTIYVDVGLEFGLAGYCVHWRADAHDSLARLHIPHFQLQENRCGVQYERDETALLRDLAGFRATLPASDSGVVKLNVYTTDKSSTALHDRGRFAKFLDAHQVIQARPEKSPKPSTEFGGRMHEIFESCRTNVQDGHARYEVRFTLDQLDTCHWAVPDDVLERSLVVIESEVWWGFKDTRVQSMVRTVDKILEAPLEERFKTNVFTLLLALIWAINGMNSRPSDFQTDIRVRDACLRVDRDGGTAAVTEGGTWFVDQLQMSPSAPHIPANRAPSEEILVKPFSAYRSWSQMTSVIVFGGGRQVLKRAASPTSLPARNNRQRRVDAIVNTEEIPESRIFILGRIQTPPGYVVPDGLTLEVYLTDIWIGLLNELIVKSPNSQSKERYYIRADDELECDSEIPFRRSADQLPTMWSTVSAKRATGTQWHQAFNRMFPGPGQTTEKETHYHVFGSRLKWLQLASQLGPAATRVIKGQLQTRFDQFTWFLECGTDKPWRSGLNRPSLAQSAGPWILLNPRVPETDQELRAMLQT